MPLRQWKKYKRCHLREDLESGRSFTYASAPINPLRDIASLRQNTLDFIECLKGDLGIVFDERSRCGVVAGDVTDGAIRRTYGRLPYFFPHDAPYIEICRSIADSQVSGFYWGSPDVNQIATHLLRYALYTPHIIVSNPFCDMMRYHLDASPIDNPGPWRQMVVNKAIFLVSIEDWIREGIVVVLPPLKWTDWDFFNNKLKGVAQNRFEQMSEEEEVQAMSHTMIELARSFHPDDLPWFVENYMEGAPSELVDRIIQSATDAYLANPIRYSWAKSEQGQVIGTGTGNNLESAVFTADLTGSYLLFGEEYYRKQYRNAEHRDAASVPSDALTKLSGAFGQLDFSFLNAVQLDYALGLRKDGKLSRLRHYLHELWSKVSSIDGIENLSVDTAFREELTDQYRQYKDEWNDIQKSVGRNLLVGVGEAGLAVLSGNLQFSVALAGLAGFQLKELMDSYSSRKKHERLPLGIFHDLEKRRS